MLKKQKPISRALQKDEGEEDKTIKENLETPSFKKEVAEVLEPETETTEKKEELRSEEIQKIRERIEKTDLDDQLKMQAVSQAQSIKILDEEKKIKKLLELAKSKGIIYAVLVAKKMDDPYVLDMLHDTLAREGYYKKFTK